MTRWTYRAWRSAGAAALISAAACSPPATPPEPPAPAAAGGESGEQGEAGVAVAFAGLDGDALTAQHLQQLKGFLLAADALAAANDIEAAARLARQGYDNAYAPSSDAFGGFNPAPLRAAGAAHDLAALRQNLRASEAAIDAQRARLDINHADLAARMLDLSSGLYQGAGAGDAHAVMEYQHSYAAALGARDALVAGRAALRGRDARAYDEAMAELARYVTLWPAPTPAAAPAPYRQVLAQSSRVRLALSPLL